MGACSAGADVDIKMYCKYIYILKDHDKWFFSLHDGWLEKSAWHFKIPWMLDNCHIKCFCLEKIAFPSFISNKSFQINFNCTYQSILCVPVSWWSWYFGWWRAHRSAYPCDRLLFCPPGEQIVQDKLTQNRHISEIACLETDGADIWQLCTDVHKLAVRGFTNYK